MNTVRSLFCSFLNATPRPVFPLSVAPVSLNMKTRPVRTGSLRPVLLFALATIAVALGSSRLVAQANQSPPERLTYQGFLVDGNGVALGNSAPKNYDVIFRIYNDQSAGNLLWSEQQTLTVDKGYFSALLGEGASTGEPRPLLSTVFRGPTASERYVGITVKGIGSGGANVDILPRLRLLTSPYAFLAQNANKIVQDTGADLITSSGNAVTIGGPITASGLSVSGNINGANISAANLSGNGANVTGINANNITTGSIPNDRTSASSLNAANTLVVRDGSGGFSMGSLAANAVLAYANVSTHQQGAYLEWNKNPGEGAAYLLNQKGGGTGGIIFGEVSTANAITEGMRLTPSGNLGIGNQTPGLRLEVNGSVGIAGANFLEFGRGIAGKEGSAGKIGYGSFTAGSLDIVGAGTTGSNRKIKLWSEGGLDVGGPVVLGGYQTYALQAFSNAGQTFAVIDDSITVWNNVDKNKWFQMRRTSSLGVLISASGGGFNNHGNYTSAISWDGDGNWDFASDRKLKQDIVDAEPMLERALQVGVRRFRWKGSAPDSKLSLGVIAQELQPLFPDLVSTQENPETKETNLAVGYSDFGLIAVKALQEFKATHDAELAELKAQMAELIELNKQLRSRLDQVSAAVGNGQ